MELIKNILRRFKNLFTLSNIFLHLFIIKKPKSLFSWKNFFLSNNEVLENFYSKYEVKNENYVSLDLGCGQRISNPFKAKILKGIDLYDDEAKNIKRCNLGFEAIPFESSTIHRVTAFDLIEHIPRHSIVNDRSVTPFIFLMNEIWRILKKGGIFLSFTPIYPFQGAFQDPTHNNILTWQTYKLYFSKDKSEIPINYGIETNFEILEEKLFDQHLISILKK